MTPVIATPLREGAAVLENTDRLDNFFREVERRAYRMAELSLGDRDEALDAVQDAMLSFVSRYSRKPEGEWLPLFYRILQNRITDLHRRRSLRDRLRGWFGRDDDPDAPDPMAAFPDPGPDPAALAIGHATGAAIEAALRSLPLRQRQAFLLRGWEGLDTEETARAMGCSAGSVKTHYFRAVHTLRTLLEEYRP